MNKKILAVIIVYQPNLQLLIDDIKSFYDNVECTLIWDNSDVTQAKKTKKELQKKFDHAIFMGEGINRGISYGLNKGWHYARDNGYEYMLTMDDDSIFEDFGPFLQSVINKREKALYGPNTIKNSHRKGFEKVNHLITSGMIVPVDLLNKAGGYYCDFFVDGIDIELCLHIKELGYECLMKKDSFLLQRYGNTISKSFLGHTFHSPNYSPFRLYGIFRNHIIILRKYRYQFSLLMHIIKLYFLGFVIKGIVLMENNKIEKIRSVIKGIKDGLNYKITR